MFQAIAWDARDTDEGYTITIYGRAETGESVSVMTLFRPYFFAQFPATANVGTIQGASIEYVQGKSLWGFTNNELQRFTKLSFKTREEMRKAVWRCKTLKAQVFESDVDPLLRFMYRSGVQSTGWFTVENPVLDYNTTSDIRFYVPDWTSIKPVARDDIAKFRIMSLDIETYSSTGLFPDAETKDDVLFQIAMTTKVYGEPTVFKKCFSLGECHEEHTECCATEKELLDKWAEYMMNIDPDVVTGWNIFGFDLEYIYKRMVVCRCDPNTFCFGRRSDIPCELVMKNLSSGALGSNVLKMVPMIGRYVFDLFHTVKAEHKLESYSLNAVSAEFLGDKKNDMPIHEMFKLYKEGKDLTRVAEYCLKDTELPIRLMETLYTFENLVEMAKATWVPLSFLSERGQQIKVFSQMARKARELNFFIPTIFDKGAVEGKYEGATVLDAQCGAYYTPITALDFAGLYPSIMIAHNLCYSTLVMSPKYANVPGVEYEDHGEFRFAQNVPSLLPEILKELKQFRKKAKADMKKYPELYNVYNGRQLAYKISMNSIYGFTGASKGMLPCMAIASTVTRQGRKMIQASKEYVEEHFPGSKVRYGDSVMPGTPVLTKNGPVCIDNLGTDWVEYPGLLKTGSDKEQCELEGVQVWTSSGWSDVKRVIRHKCQKKIYRVLTHTGLVDVTEDHSLLTPDIQQVKPKDVVQGTELLHGFPETLEFIIDRRGDFYNDAMKRRFGRNGSMRPQDPDDMLSRQIAYIRAKSMGKFVRIYNDDTNSPRILWQEKNFSNAYKNSCIKKISVLHENYDGYVYDLETADGTFQAGVGQLIVKNTDSIMVEFDVGTRTGQEAIDYSWELGERASKEITGIFKAPNELELEKVYCPYFLYSKKRYAAKKWEGPVPCTFKEVDIKGLQVIRRDNCPFVREVCKTLIDMILESSNPERPLQFIDEQRRELLAGNVPMEKLVLSKRLASEYKNNNLAHVVVRNKMRERAPGSEPQSGDRVQFVILPHPKKTAKMYEKAESYEYARDNGLPLDYAYYLKHQFENPVADLLEPLVG